MSNQTIDNDWKIKLRSGILKTPYHHFSIIAEGIALSALKNGFDCPLGSAFMSMKAWATSEEEAMDMMQSIAQNIGFTVSGKIEVYTTEPTSPPGENPSGYDISFSSFEK